MRVTRRHRLGLQTIENRRRLSEGIDQFMNNPANVEREAGRRVEKHSNGMPESIGAVFTCGESASLGGSHWSQQRQLATPSSPAELDDQWYGKPLKQRGLLSHQADIRQVTGASSSTTEQPSFKVTTESALFQRLAVPLWFPPGKDIVVCQQIRGHSVHDFAVAKGCDAPSTIENRM